MILGVSHLSLSTTDAAATKAALEVAGYTTVSFETGVPNGIRKQPLLARYDALHDIGLYRRNSGIMIEAIRHHDELFDPPSGYDVSLEDSSTITLQVPDPENDKVFWIEALRFRSVSNEEDSVRLKLASAVPNWQCNLVLKRSTEVRPWTLDSKGYPCLALLTMNLEKSLADVRAAGATDVLEPYEVRVGGKDMTISMFRTPTGALVEFIRVDRRERS